MIQIRKDQRFTAGFTLNSDFSKCSYFHNFSVKGDKKKYSTTVGFTTPCWPLHAWWERVADIRDAESVFSEKSIPRQQFYWNLNHLMQAKNFESLPETINTSHLSFLICLGFLIITPHSLPFIFGGYYQWTAMISSPGKEHTTFVLGNMSH